MIVTVKHKQKRQKTYPRKLSWQTSSCSWPTIRRNKNRKLLGYVQCDKELSENLSIKFANFRPILKNTLVNKNDNLDLRKTYAKEEGILCQPQKMLISSFTEQNGTLIPPLFLFYLHLEVVVTEIHCFVEYPPRKIFDSLVQSAVDNSKQGDDNPNSSVLAETMKLLANTSYGYQTMDRSRHAVTKYLSDEKTKRAINSKLFRKLDHLNNAFYEVELAKAQIEHKEPFIVGFQIFQYA